MNTPGRRTRWNSVSVPKFKGGDIIPKDHSAVGYIYDSKEGFKTVEQTRPVKNDLGLNLFVDMLFANQRNFPVKEGMTTLIEADEEMEI